MVSAYYRSVSITDDQASELSSMWNYLTMTLLLVILILLLSTLWLLLWYATRRDSDKRNPGIELYIHNYSYSCMGCSNAHPFMGTMSRRKFELERSQDEVEIS